jgi:hypothetical protein
LTKQKIIKKETLLVFLFYFENPIVLESSFR